MPPSAQPAGRPVLSELRRRELADFLRTRRARLRPDDVGLPAGARRRTLGLRREEVAGLAGVSVEWYTRLEQARDVRASESVLRRVAEALRLAPDESRHLLTLGGYGSDAAPRDTAPRGGAPAHLQRLIDQLGLGPAWVVDERCDIVAWNRAATVIYGDLAAMPEPDRNVYVQVFLRPRMRETLVDWAPNARDCVARLRAAHARNVDDPWFGALVARLRAGSAEFDGWWNAHDVRVPQSGTKHFEHPGAGRLSFEYTLLDVAGEPSPLQIVTYLPSPGSGTEEKMAALLHPALPIRAATRSSPSTSRHRHTIPA